MTKIGTRILMSAIISMLVTALSGMGLSGTAQAATCLREGLPDVRVTVAMSPVHTNTTQTLAQLSSRDNNTHLGIMDGHYVGGLTVGDIKAQSQIGFDSSVSFFTGNTCLWVQSLTVDLSLQSSIYIARELARGSCEYRE